MALSNEQLLNSGAIAALGLQGRDFLREADFTAAELDSLIRLADALAIAKRSGHEPQFLHRKNVALIFEKTSTRTRCAFEVAAYDQGGHVTYIDPVSSQIGHKESIEDTAQVLSRFYDGIEFRGSAHSVAEALAEAASVPVFNGLTDQWHPTQMLADFLAMAKSRGSFDWSTLSYTYLGDARNNVGNSLLVMGALMGSDVRIAAPQSLQPEEEVQNLARELAAISGARITVTTDPQEAVDGAQFIHTDVWVSMGEPESAWIERIDALRPYRITPELMAASGDPLTKFMHCLPPITISRPTPGAMPVRSHPTSPTASRWPTASSAAMPASSSIKLRTAFTRSKPLWWQLCSRGWHHRNRTDGTR